MRSWIAFPCTDLFILLLIAMGVLVWRHRTSGGPWTDRCLQGLAFLIVWVVYLANFRWRGAGDVVASSLLPFSILRHGNIYLNEFYSQFLSDNSITGTYLLNGHRLSIYTSAPGVLLTPVYLIPALFGATPTDALIHQLQKIGSSFMVAFSAYLLLRILAHRLRRAWAVGLTLAYALGTESWAVSSQAIWQHGPSELFLALGLWALLGTDDTEPPRFGWAGFAFAMAVWCRYSDILVYALVGAYVLFHRRSRLGEFILGSLLPLACLFADNYAHSQSLFHTGYPASLSRFDATWYQGFFGLLVSPGRGLFLYTPFMLFVVWGFIEAWCKPGWIVWRYLSAACLATLLFYTKYHSWPGGWCFGPRYLADLSPLLVLGILPVVDRLERSFALKTLFIAAVAYSVVVQALGAFFTWWWEPVPEAAFWSWSHDPVTYLLGRLPHPHPSDQFMAAWILLAALAALVFWLVRRFSFQK